MGVGVAVASGSAARDPICKPVLFGRQGDVYRRESVSVKGRATETLPLRGHGQRDMGIGSYAYIDACLVAYIAAQASPLERLNLHSGYHVHTS